MNKEIVEPSETIIIRAHFYPGQETPSQITEHYHNLSTEEVLSRVPQSLADMIAQLPRARIEYIVFEYERLSSASPSLEVYYTDKDPLSHYNTNMTKNLKKTLGQELTKYSFSGNLLHHEKETRKDNQLV